MSMTQVVTDALSPDASPLSVITIPTPRSASPATFVTPAAVAAPAPVTPITATPAQVDDATTSPLGPALPAVALDLVLGAAVATTIWFTGQLPLTAAAAMSCIWPLTLAASGRYRRQTLGQSRATRATVLVAAGARSAVLALAAAPWLDGAELRGLGVMTAALTTASAVPFLAVRRRQRPRVVLAGRPRDVRALLEDLGTSSHHEVVAVCLTRPSKEVIDLPTYVGFESSSAVASHHRADALVVLPGARVTPSEVRRLHWSLAGRGCRALPRDRPPRRRAQRTRVMSRRRLRRDACQPTGAARPPPSPQGRRREDRRAGGLVVCLALLAGLAVAIRRETPGPAMFRQERIGRDGVPSRCSSSARWASTPRPSADALRGEREDGTLFKIVQDPRVTPLGRIRRRYSLDELPQLWNVVRGDMSLVGPRPRCPARSHGTRTTPSSPGGQARHDGPVAGLGPLGPDLRGDGPARPQVRRELVVATGPAILVRTVRAVLGHRGAY